MWPEQRGPGALGKRAQLIAGIPPGWRPEWEWVQRLPLGEEVEVWAGRRLPQTGRPNGPAQGGGERWRERTQVGRFPGQGDEQMCVYARVSECMLVCVHSHVCMSIFLTY